LGVTAAPVFPSATTSVSPHLPRTDLASQLVMLKQLRDQGALTDDEFAKAKAKLLATP
jgi:hypothetical protein